MKRVKSDLFIEEPAISVIIITFNQESYIRETIESVINQQIEVSIEIIIGEDCSNDKTREICIEYQQKYPEIIRLLLQDENVGLLKNYQDVLQECRGEYIAQCAGDDFWCDNYKLSKQHEYINNNSNIGFVHSDYYVLSNKSINLVEHEKKQIDFVDLLKHNYICAPTVFFRKELVDEYFQFVGDNYFNFLMEDYPLWLFIAKKHQIGYINEPLVTYRQLEHSVSNIKDPKKDLDFQFSVVSIKRFYVEQFDLDKAMIHSEMSDFFQEALHVCYSLTYFDKYPSLKENFEFWNVSVSYLNKLRLIALKNKYVYLIIDLFFKIKSNLK